MSPRRRDETNDPLDDDLDTARVRPPDDPPIYSKGRGHVPTVIDAPFRETFPETEAPPPNPPRQPLFGPPDPLGPPPLAPSPLGPLGPAPGPPMARPAPGRKTRKNDWTSLVVALVVSTVVMAACCLAGLALFSTLNSSR